MTDKEALDRLIGINMSLEQKQALIDVIKNINKNNDTEEEDIPLIGIINDDIKEFGSGGSRYICTITPIDNTFIPVVGKLYKLQGIKMSYIIFYFSNKDVDEGEKYFESNLIVLTEGQGTIFNMNSTPYTASIYCSINKNNIIERFEAELKAI